MAQSGSQPTILQIVPRLDAGGAELSAIEIAEALVAAGARALVVTAGGRMADRISDAGGELIILPADTKNPAKLLANARVLTRLVREHGVNLIHARSRAPAWSALLAARWSRVPFVTTYHGAYGEKNAVKRFYNSVMVRSDVVIANSGYTRDLIRQRYGTPEARIRVIHRGVDAAQFDPQVVAPARVLALREAWGVQADQKIVLLAARLTSWKGQTVLVDAAAELAASGRLRDGVVILAGDAQGRDGYVEGLQRRISAHGLGDKVRLVGHVTDMPAAFLASHVAIVASTEPEAFGRSAAEAQAMLCPVIATRIGAPQETVAAEPDTPAHEATGWLVPPADVNGLADSIAAVLALTPNERAAIGARARAHIGKFSLAAMKSATLSVYDGLLGTRLADTIAGPRTP